MDLAEVELVDTYLDEPRGNDSQLLAVSLKNKSLIHMKTRQKLVKMYESLCDTSISRERWRVTYTSVSADIISRPLEHRALFLVKSQQTSL